MKRTSGNTALKLAIWECGVTQTDLAKVTGIHESRLSRLVRGHDEPRADEQKAIAKALRLPIDQIFPAAVAS